MKAYILILLLCLSPLASAIDSRQFANPEQKQAYEELTSELRCLVCQNQTIADSNAELAGDLRRQVQEMLEQGKSRDDIVTFMTDRYGDFVLYKPPFKLKTGLLWVGPVAFLLLGLLAIVLVIRHKKTAVTDATIGTTPEKLAKIRRLPDEGEHS